MQHTNHGWVNRVNNQLNHNASNNVAFVQKVEIIWFVQPASRICCW